MIGQDTTVYVEYGQGYTIHLNIDPEVTTSRYIWFKDALAFDTTSANYYLLSDITDEDVGIYTCQVTNSESVVDITLSSHPVRIQIFSNRQSQTIAFDSIADRTYGDSSFVLRASSSADLSVTYQITKGEGSVITLKDGTVTIVGTGQATIAVQQDGNEEYLPATAVVRRFTVNKLLQKITFAKLDSAWVGDTLALVASSDASLPVNFSVSGPVRLEADRLILTGEGQVTITATQAGNEAYLSAEDVVQTITVEPPLYSLSGQVFQGEGIPYTGVAAAVLYPSHGLIRRGDFRQQLLDEQGTYRFDGLEAGRYVFKVSVRSERYIPTYWRGHYLIIEAGSIPIQRDTVIDVTLLSAPERYKGTAIIRGRLVSISTNGRTSQADFSFAEISVFLRDTQTGELVAYAVTNEAGAFEFTNLPEGEYSFVADYEGLATGENTVRVSNNQETVITVTVADEITVVQEETVITAVDENEVSASIQIFPNPVTDQLRIKATGPLWVGATVRLQNVLGNTVAEIVIRHALTTLDMSDQKAGMYLLTVRQGDVLETRKVMKQ